MKKRILSLLLCIVMCLSLIPMSALADGLPVLNANISGGILSWDALENAASYYWNIGEGEKSCGGIAETTSIDLNSKCESNGFSAGDYEVTLYARNSSNTRISEEWKGTFHYNSTQETLDAPTSLRVEDSICKWNAVTNATSYIVAFQDADGRSYGSATVNDSQYAIDPYNISLVDGQDYKFMVKASAAGYVDSEYSESALFTYSKPSTTVTLQNVTISGGILSWDALEGAASYCWNIGEGVNSCGGNAETTSIDLNSKCEFYGFSAGDYEVTLYARNSSNTQISEKWKGTFDYDPSVPITFKDLPETGVTNITVSEGDEEIGTAIKDAFVLYCKDNIKADGEYAFIDYRFEDGGTFYHTWIVKIQSGTITAADGGSSSLDGILLAVNNQNPVYDWWINGTYSAIHTHAFTYTANNGKITATCVDGCDDGYDTNPLTLTLTAPASLVYNRNAKAFTFADDEAAAWTGAGLELPIITYAAKSGSSLTSDKAVDAGSYTASVTVDTDKTASLDFEITKATPYIKTPPAPNEIEYGQKLADSTLVDGYVHISSTDSPEVAGLFEWTNPDTVPGIDDSEVTLYDVTFTPVDTNNYNTASCQVTIRVTHTTHNPTLVNGQDPTENENGWKDYYECICGERYEDASGSILIPDLAVWKAEGGNGYIPKLEPTPEPEPEPDPINYKIIEGAQSTWSLDDVDDSPLFRSDADFSKFVRVELDGKVLDPANYTAKPGSTIIELKPAFAAKLAPGKHTIEIVSTDGSASTVFYIEETIANTDGEGFALSTAAMSSAFIGCNIVGLAVVFFELKKKKKVR